MLSSRRRFRKFLDAYRQGRIRELVTDDAAARDEKSEYTRSAEKDQRRRYLRMYARWLQPHGVTIGSLLLLTLLAVGVEMSQPLFLRYLINDVMLADELTRGERVTRLHVTGVLFLAVVILSRSLETGRNLLQRLLNVRVLLTLRHALFDRLLNLPLGNLTDMKIGGVISRLSGDIDRTSGLLQLAVISPGVSVVRLLVAMGILTALNWRLALVAVVVLPPALGLSMMIARRVRPIYRSMRKESAAVDARASETFGGIRVVRSFQRELREEQEFIARRHTIVRKELFAHRRELLLWTSWGFLLGGVNVVIVWAGGWMQIVGTAKVGDITAFQVYALMLLQPVWQIVNSFSEMQRALASMDRVFEVLDTPEDKPDRPQALDAPARIEQVAFDHVSFAYNEGTPVLRDVDFHVAGGSVVALVGRSGAGKTTVTDLIARFHDPTEGAVRVNGVDLRNLRLASYRSLLGVVQQDVFLFDGTVRENIAYGRPHASEEEIIDAAVRANAHEFITELGQPTHESTPPGDDQSAIGRGYDARIGERGVKLSGGQAQRLSIARAILADPRILILDEATSNLDTQSEQLIQQSLDELMHGPGGAEGGSPRTTFVIAHRLSTVAQADLILVMDQGQIVERGAHDELLERGGLYHEMVTRQRDAMQSDTRFGA